MKRKYFLVVLVLILAMLLSGCGGGIVTPAPDEESVQSVQEVLSVHDLAEQKLNDIVEGPGIDTEGTLNILGEYLNEQTCVESTFVDGNLLQINYTSGLISFILLQDISTVPTLGGNIVRENTLSTPSYFRTTATNALEVRSDLNNSSIQITKDLDDVVYTGNRDVLIWAPIAAEHNTEGCNNTWSCNVVSEFVNSFKGSTLSFNITTLDNDKADVASLQNITDYSGMVIFYTHGEKKGKWLQTGEVVDTFWYLGGYNLYYKLWLLAKHMVVWQNIKVKGEGGVLVSKPVYAVNSSWFNSNLSGNFSNTIILNISCYSAKTDALWNVFKDKGAGAYFGLTDETSGGFGITRGCNLIEKLSEENLTTGDAYEKDTTDPYYPNTTWIMWGKENLKFPKDTPIIPVSIIMEEFNGSTIGNSWGITYTNTINGQGAVFSRVKESRIEYPFSIGFPHEGTIEYLIKIYNGYRYIDYVLNDNLDCARIFDTGIQDVWYPGAMWIDVCDNGRINLGTATTYGQPEYHNLEATGTDFAFNEWHTIGISFGSQGQYIMLDGNIVASNASYTESLQTCGNFTSAVNVPTVGELVSCFWVNNRHDAGFEGVIDRFRVSEKQKDWYLSNTFPSQY